MNNTQIVNEQKLDDISKILPNPYTSYKSNRDISVLSKSALSLRRPHTQQKNAYTVADFEK